MNKLKMMFMFISVLSMFHSELNAQTEVSLKADYNEKASPFLSQPLLTHTPSAITGKDRNTVDRTGYHPKKDWKLNSFTNPNALPVGDDPFWQKKYNNENERSHGSILGGWNGIASDGNFYPGDPSLDVGPNHVIQMTNDGAGVGGQVAIWDKSGTVLIGETLLESLTGINGSGDPIVLYDQLAQRWLLTEFKPNIAGNQGMIFAISQTSDPLGSYWIYEFDFTAFPDYPKIGVWGDSYVLTTNQGGVAFVYAFDKQAMLTGATANFQAWNLTNFPSLAFEPATPVDAQGTSIPADQDPMIMRMADDAWGAAITNDRLEYFTIDVDWTNPPGAILTGPTFLNTAAFDTELCGFVAFSCIDQPGSATDLDPLREVLMNKIEYRDFGTYASIVCNHTVDVNNTDRAGIRWYELRRPSGGSWAIHQQGTYSPNATNRWMGSITQNAYGEILLAYNVSDASVFPGLRFTGRESGDALGTMTIAETTIVNGTTANGSNRYGDYNTAVVDPVDESFWFTGQYNPTTQWASYVSHISSGGPGCSDALVLTGTLDGDYFSSGTIMTDGTVPNGNEVGLYAPGITTLSSGFTSAFGGDLEVNFGDCSIFAPPSEVDESALMIERDRKTDPQNQAPNIGHSNPNPEMVEKDRSPNTLTPVPLVRELSSEEKAAVEKQILLDRKSNNN